MEAWQQNSSRLGEEVARVREEERRLQEEIRVLEQQYDRDNDEVEKLYEEQKRARFGKSGTELLGDVATQKFIEFLLVMAPALEHGGELLSLRFKHQKLTRRIEALTRERAAVQAWLQDWGVIRCFLGQPGEGHYQSAKLAYRRLALAHHPDKGGRHEAFVSIKDAYEAAEASYHQARARERA